MPPSLETLPRLNIELPKYDGISSPFGAGRPKFYKEISDTAEGKTSRTNFFEKNVVGLYWALNKPVPYAFYTKDGSIRSLDAGCVKFLCNRGIPELEILRDEEGYIIGVIPSASLLARYEMMRNVTIAPYLQLMRRLDLPFDISRPVDERRRILSERVVREGAAEFRRDVLRVWEGRCAISRIDVKEVIEAAHIFPYLGMSTNDLRNAILLKSDLHILFDAHLISLEYVDGALVLRVSARLKQAPYGKYEGKHIKLPESVTHQPAQEVVEEHFKKFIEKQQA